MPLQEKVPLPKPPQQGPWTARQTKGEHILHKRHRGAGDSGHSLGQLRDLIASLDVGDATSDCSSDHQPGLVDLLGLLLKSFTHFLCKRRRTSMNVNSKLTFMTILRSKFNQSSIFHSSALSQQQRASRSFLSH